MKNSVLTLLLTAIALAQYSCDKPNLENAIYIPDGGWQLKIPDAPASETATCTMPPPPPEGCVKPCKPCFIYICKNGEWQRTKIENPPGMCRGQRPPSGTPINVCPRTSTGGCPPECAWCF